MKKLAFLGGAVGLGIVAAVGIHHGQAADHLDSLATLGTQPMADINDVYAWNTVDGTKVNLAMTVSPKDPGTRSFGASVQYVFHLTTHAAFGMPGIGESKVVCTFTANDDGKCWLIDPMGKVVDYVGGDLSGPNGRVSDSGKFRVFAGQRSDPFFFNLIGFQTAVKTVKDNPTLAPITELDKCPDVLGPVAKTLRDELTDLTPDPNGVTTANGVCPPEDSEGDPQADCFAEFNVMAIVVQIDKDELDVATNHVLSVWASTYAAP